MKPSLRFAGNLISFILAVGALNAEARGPKCRSFAEGEKVTLTRIQEIVELCKPKTAADLLDRFRPEFLERNIVVYGSRSLQPASPAEPRSIVLSRNGDLALAFSAGSPRTVDFMQFNGVTEGFEFQRAVFPFKGRAAMSAVNPPDCRSCHGQVEPRPIWDAYFFWPGVHGSEDDEPLPSELKNLGEFIAGRAKKPPYSKLPRIQSVSASDVNDLLGPGNVKNIARLIRDEPRLRPLRYALLGAMTCNDPIEDFLPARWQAVRAPFRAYYEDTERKNRRSLEQRLERHRELTGLTVPIAQRVRRAAESRRAPERPDMTARMRYLVEGAGVSMKEWSTEFGSNVPPGVPGYSPNYAFDDRGTTFDRLQRLRWRDYLNPNLETDRWLYGRFKLVSDTDGKGQSDLITFGEESGTICAKLRERSKAVLEPLEPLGPREKPAR